jgi:hypothetical protein
VYVLMPDTRATSQIDRDADEAVRQMP